MLDFRILGPLEIVADGEPVVLPRPKHQELLALLLMRRGEVVSTDWLLEHLWAGSPPASARASLQNHVSQLRRALGRETLVTRSPGYLLTVEAERTDVGRFERLVAEGFVAERAAERAAKLREGLALWRGPALAGVRCGAFGEVEAARLEELRVEALEDAIEAELELGAGAELVSELEQLVAREPFRERLRAQLMLALYRSGRQADALEAFQRARATLGEELGLEPGPALRGLERAILNHDPTLDRPQAVALPLGQRRKLVTVLFADLVESTVLADELDPERFRRLLDRYFSAARAAIERHGGTVEKFIGDAVMAVFGVPQAHEDDALRAVRAAVDMRSGLAALNEGLAREGVGPLELRIGVNSGEVFVGDPAGGRALVTGSVVNQAKRLEEAARPGEIVLGAATLRLVRDAVHAKAVRVPQLKQERPVSAFRLIRFTEAGPAIARYFEAALVGRHEELAAIRRTYEKACETRRARLLTVIGEPGIGKTRLAREFLATVGGSATVLVGRCVAYGDGATFLPLREMINQVSDLQEELAGDAASEAVTSRVAELVGLAPGTGTIEEGFWAIRRLLEALACERPLVLVFEDVHWAEPTLLDLIAQLDGITGSILCLCIARPDLLERRSSWDSESLALKSLPEPDLEALVGAFPGGKALSAELRARIVEAAGGNPLFAEQLLAHVREHGAEGVATVPPSVEALIASRVDLLEGDSRALLERAAVIGPEFSRAAISALSPEQALPALSAKVVALVRKGLVRPTRSATPEGELFRFHHVLVRDVAYSALPKAARADLHERLGDWLDQEPDKIDEIVGYHFEQAARYWNELEPGGARGPHLATRAAQRLRSASVAAFRRGDIRGANRLLERAASLLPKHSVQRLRLLPEIARAAGRLGDADPRPGDAGGRPDHLIAEAIEGARAIGDNCLEQHALLAQALLRPQLSGAEEAVAIAEEAIGVFEKEGDRFGLAKAWRLVTRVHWESGRSATAMRAAECQIEHARALTSENERPMLDALAENATEGAVPVEDALRLCDDLLQRTAGNRRTEATILGDRAHLKAMAGRFSDARLDIARAKAIADELNFALFVAASDVAFLADQAAVAEREARTAKFVPEDDPVRAAILADALYIQRRYDEAEPFARLARETADPDLFLAIATRGLEAKLVGRRGEHEAAEQGAREGVTLSQQTEWLNLRGRVLLDLAEVLLLANRPYDAATAATDAVRLYEQKGNLVSARKARALLEELRRGSHLAHPGKDTRPTTP